MSDLALFASVYLENNNFMYPLRPCVVFLYFIRWQPIAKDKEDSHIIFVRVYLRFALIDN